MSGRRWTPAQDALLSRMWDAQHSSRGIAAELGRTAHAVTVRAAVLGLGRRTRKSPTPARPTHAKVRATVRECDRLAAFLRQAEVVTEIYVEERLADAKAGRCAFRNRCPERGDCPVATQPDDAGRMPACFFKEPKIFSGIAYTGSADAWNVEPL